MILTLPLPDMRIIDIHDGTSIFPQILDHPHLLMNDVLHGSKGLQMLRADRRQYRDIRPDEAHQLMQLPTVIRAHFA